jgi:hypothetical protein
MFYDAHVVLCDVLTSVDAIYMMRSRRKTKKSNVLFCISIRFTQIFKFSDEKTFIYSAL